MLNKGLRLTRCLAPAYVLSKVSHHYPGSRCSSVARKVYKPQHTTSGLWALAYAIFSTWHAIHSLHHQSHELLFILQNPAKHCQLHEALPKAWISGLPHLGSLQESCRCLLSYISKTLPIYFHLLASSTRLGASSSRGSIRCLFLDTDKVPRTQQVLKK